jgi:hypothetical protein
MEFIQRWLKGRLATGVIVDIIVDANHAVKYLKHTATWSLLTTSGHERQTNDQRLSPVSKYIYPRLSIS